MAWRCYRKWKKRRWNRSRFAEPIKMRGSSSAAEEQQNGERIGNNRKKEVVPEYDSDLLERIFPPEGFRSYGNLQPHGTGYESCLHIWEFPGSLDDYWLTEYLRAGKRIVTISIHTDDQAEIKKT